MTKFSLFKNSTKNTPPIKKTSNKDDVQKLNKWMSDDYKIKSQELLSDPVELDEEFQSQETIVAPKDGRIETGLLKNRIADKIKKLNPPT